MAVVQSRKIGKKRKRGESGMEDISTQSHKAWYGVVNYLPDRPAGEGDKSIQEHITWMPEEKRVRPKN